MSKVTLGGERLGSGNRQKVDLRTYSRSTHDLSFVWRSTMSSGTLVPFMSEVALPGDTFEIKLDTDIKTHPTIGPLFGSYKVQLDVFQIPVRLYNAELHMNKLNIGLKMSNVKLPQLTMLGYPLEIGKNLDNQQVNPSCIYSYLNMRGAGVVKENSVISRSFNAVPYLAYWDIYKNYYANKQEEVGAVIHNPLQTMKASEITIQIRQANGSMLGTIPVVSETTNATSIPIEIQQSTVEVRLLFSDIEGLRNARLERMIFKYLVSGNTLRTTSLDELFLNWQTDESGLTMTATSVNPQYRNLTDNPYSIVSWRAIELIVNELPLDEYESEPQMKFFPLENIDKMREKILQWSNYGVPFTVNDTELEPYILPDKILPYGDAFVPLQSKLSSQEGLALKTYQSDLFNNWLSTEWIDGENGINEITKVITTDGGFTIDELNLSKKIYDMLNQIAISGGSYDDWIDATYTHERVRAIENPMYIGGLIKELTFQEVISNAESADATQPLGTLAGRGVMTNKNKGGYIKAKVDEPSYIMGIISLTPRVDYSQGNKWDTDLKTMDDFHKPALDQIGFQNLITEQMAWWDTNYESGQARKKSAGKQPAWINYMTNVNVIRGNFAESDQQQFMVLDRKYTPLITPDGLVTIQDLTTYIDPSKYNHIFAYTKRDAQNFWAQIKINMTARRKMSAKIIPNL